MVYDFDLKDLVRPSRPQLARWEVRTMRKRLLGVALLLSAIGALETGIGGPAGSFVLAGVLAALGAWFGFQR